MPSASAASTVAAKAPAAATGFDAVLAPLTGGAGAAPARGPSAAKPPGHPQPLRAPGKTTAANLSPHSLTLQPDGESDAATAAIPAVPTAATLALPSGLSQPSTGAAHPAMTGGDPHPDTSGTRPARSTQDDRPSAGAKDEPADLPDEATLGMASGASPGAEPSIPDDTAADAPGTRAPAGPKTGRAHKGSTDDRPASASAAAGAPPGLAFSIADDAGAQRASVSPAGVQQAGPATVAGAQGPASKDAAGPAPATDAAAAPPPQEAAQPGRALAAIHAGPDGSSHVRILLNPAELGSVQVSITRTHDGVSSVSVAVERPETLRTLQTDLGHLHQALDRAGLPDQRSVTLHLATPDAGRDAASGQGGSGDNGTAWGGSQQGQQGTRQERPYSQPMPALAPAGQIDNEPDWTPAAWRRAGVNITA